MDVYLLKSFEIKKLFIYILCAYGLSELFALLLILNPDLDSKIIYYILMFLAQFGPFISSFVTTFDLDGKDGIRKLLHRGIYWRFCWYINDAFF